MPSSPRPPRATTTRAPPPSCRRASRPGATRTRPPRRRRVGGLRLHGGQSPYGRTVWYRWHAPADGHAVFAATSAFDNVLAVYRDGNPAPLMCDDDPNRAGPSRIEMNVTAGDYLLQVAGYGTHSAAAGQDSDCGRLHPSAPSSPPRRRTPTATATASRTRSTASPTTPRSTRAPRTSRAMASTRTATTTTRASRCSGSTPRTCSARASVAGSGSSSSPSSCRAARRWRCAARRRPAGPRQGPCPAATAVAPTSSGGSPTRSSAATSTSPVYLTRTGYRGSTCAIATAGSSRRHGAASRRGRGSQTGGGEICRRRCGETAAAGFGAAFAVARSGADDGGGSATAPAHTTLPTLDATGGSAQPSQPWATPRCCPTCATGPRTRTQPKPTTSTTHPRPRPPRLRRRRPSRRRRRSSTARRPRPRRRLRRSRRVSERACSSQEPRSPAIASKASSATAGWGSSTRRAQLALERARRAEDPGAAAQRRRVVPPALPPRGADPGGHRPPAHHHDLRGRRDRRRAVHRHAPRAGPDAKDLIDRAPARGGADAADPQADRAGARRRARGRASSIATSSRRTSSSASRDHPYLADFGLTKGTNEVGLTRDRPVRRHDRLRRARADPRRAGDARQRRLLARRRPLRVPDRRGPYAKPSDAAVLFAHMTEPPPLVTDQRPGPARRARRGRRARDGEGPRPRARRAPATSSTRPSAPSGAGSVRRSRRRARSRSPRRPGSGSPRTRSPPTRRASARCPGGSRTERDPGLDAELPPAEALPSWRTPPTSRLPAARRRDPAPGRAAPAPRTGSARPAAAAALGDQLAPAEAGAGRAVATRAGRPLPRLRRSAPPCATTRRPPCARPRRRCRSRRRPAASRAATRRRWWWRGCGPAVAAVAVAAGLLIGNRRRDPAAAPRRPRCQLRGQRRAGLSFPAPGAGHRPPAIEGLDLARPVALSAGARGGGVVAGRTAATGPTLLPAAFVKRLRGPPGGRARAPRRVAGAALRGLRPGGAGPR